MSEDGLEVSPRPWELIEANEHHGAYVVNAYGVDVCDLYAMSNPNAASVRNGGTSYPIAFSCADGNAAFIVRACNAHDDLVAALKATEREYEDLEDYAPVDSGCIECTLGTVPNHLNTGLCAHHLRKAALAKAESRP